MKGLFCVLLDVQVLGLNTNSIEMFFDLISIKIRTRDLTVKGCGVNQLMSLNSLAPCDDACSQHSSDVVVEISGGS